MPNKMLIDATHPEETRVVVLRGNRVEEFDFESASRRQLRGNIYLAKVTRVEPSLQAAFVDYGGNRHGFLAFSEIHPDYYQIPVADRQALIDEEERAHRDAEAEADRRAGMRRRPRHRPAARNAETISSEPADAAGGDGHPDRHEFEAGAETAPEADAGDAGHRTEFEHGGHQEQERQEQERSRTRTSNARTSSARLPRTRAPTPATRTRRRRHNPGKAASPTRPIERPRRRRPANPGTAITRPGPRTSIPPMPASRNRATTAVPITMTAAKTAKARKRKSSNPSAAPMRWKRFRTVRRATGASTRSRR